MNPALALSNAEFSDSSEVVLRVENVCKRFGAIEALRGISLEVRHAERLALLGPNGAGKTTLVRTMSGRVVPDSGRILMLDRSIRENGALQQLGVIPQELAIYPDLTAKQNLECFGQLHGLRGKRLSDRVDWALQWIGLTDRANELTKTFSGGMKRRVNIACGVLHRPRVLLLDEPTVGVDPQSRQRIFDMLDELHIAGTSIVLTTHHLDEAEQRTDRIIVVDHGQVIAEGTLDRLIEETIGTKRQVVMTIEGLMVAVPLGLSWDPIKRVFTSYVDDVVADIPILLHRIQSVGGKVTDLSIHHPDLHSVFLHLPSKELRE